jgi:hypothetical protein
MANIQRCEQGHFYDVAVHRRCPSCGIPGLDVNPSRPVAVPPMGDAPPGGTRGDFTRAAARAPEPGATRGVREAGGNDGRTVAWWDKEKSGTNPVVGWLVAIDGPTKGRDYRLYSEGNSIGRDVTNKVAIQDETVSRQKHCIIYYDPRSEESAFHLQGGDGPLVYLNDQAVYQPTRLKAYDILKLGKSKLLFIPLCNEFFQWTIDDEGGAAPS